MLLFEAKEKYRGVFEIQKSGDKTSSGEIGLDIRTHASPKVGKDQVSLFTENIKYIKNMLVSGRPAYPNVCKKSFCVYSPMIDLNF